MVGCRFGSQLPKTIKEQYLQCGIFPVSLPPRTQLHDRLVVTSTALRPDWNDFLFSTISTGTLEYLTQIALRPEAESGTPAQYGVFELLGPSPTIFNFNLDGLASKHCPKLRVPRTTWKNRHPLGQF